MRAGGRTEKVNYRFNGRFAPRNKAKNMAKNQGNRSRIYGSLSHLSKCFFCLWQQGLSQYVICIILSNHHGPARVTTNKYRL